MTADSTSKSDRHNSQQLQYYQNQILDYEKDSWLLQRGLNRAYQRKARIIGNCIAEIKPKRITEIGSGSGLMTYFLSQIYDEEIVALDLSEGMLAVAKERILSPKVSFVVGDGANPDLPDGSFDAVVGVDIIHHLSDPSAAMAAWRRLVRPAGRMVFLETNAYNPLNFRNIGVEHEVRSFLNTDKNLAKWSRDAGWNKVNVTPAPSFTPSRPLILSGLFDLIDNISPHIPIWKKMSALWLLSAEK